MSDSALRLAMWSGPRNISTAMMRSWGNRPDTFVCDEPFYAHYLQATGLPHPAAQEVIAAGETDWRQVVEWLTGPVPRGRRLFYQKHMTHHLLPHIGREWFGRLRHCFLLREPEAVLTSYLRKHHSPTAEDLGYPQQREIFLQVAEMTGVAPPVLETRSFLQDPEGHLRALCHWLGVDFLPEMLRWEPGLRETDGVWARHWYGEVENSTGFKPFREKGEPVPEEFRDLVQQCRLIYEELLPHRLKPRH